MDDYRNARLMAALVLMLAALMPSGCSRGPETAFVSGTVTYDGQPLDDATIEFDHLDGSRPTTLDISGGQFSGEVLVGEKAVRFFALRPSKPNPRLGPTDVQNPFENILPDRVGHDSDMKLTVGSGEETDLKYELASDG
jgi:hypothetical protein